MRLANAIDVFGEGPPSDAIDELVEQIAADAFGDEAYWSFLQAFEDEVDFPVAAALVGTAVVVIGIDLDGDERRWRSPP